ncbi:MAG: hypothetical protein M3342_18215 [Bacteroidota bacterium]|nr:hypothetical protein [Flavisolibacter sp.]MDQ3845923.1 hypothetical protein [Bacteroidota bacterium]
MIYQFSFIERILLSKNVIPHPMVDAASSVGLAKALCVSVKTGITDALSAVPQRSDQIAQQCNLSAKGTEVILNCLDALGYVTKGTAGYAFNKRGLKFLSKDSPYNCRYFILFCDWTYSSFTNLEETIRRGEQSQMNLERFTEHEWELFSRAMIDLAKTNVAEVSRKIILPADAKKLIDLGGSHGMYSIELCKKYPGLSATVADLEPVRKYMDETVTSHGMTDRVQFMPVDFIKQEFGNGYDAALLFNIIHGMTPEKNIDLFKRIAAALTEKGQLVVLDQIKGTGGNTPLAKSTTSYMAVNLLHQANGNTYSFEEVKTWGESAGFQKFKLKKLNAPGFALIFCEK